MPRRALVGKRPGAVWVKVFGRPPCQLALQMCCLLPFQW